MADASNFRRFPPLPFENAPDGSQESWLEPSLSADPKAEAFRLFQDNTCTESQFRAAGMAGNASERASGRTSDTAPPKAQLRAIYLDYLVYYRHVASQLGKAGKASGSKEWDRVAPPSKSETVWKVDLSYYTWADCQQEIIRLCAPTRKHIGDHLRRLQEQGLLKWLCILHRDPRCGQNKNYYVTNDADFAPFVQAVGNNSSNKAMIKILMDDPNKSAKDSEEAKKVDDSLAMNYADEDTRLALQRVHTRLAVNPKSDVGAQERMRLVADITHHIRTKYGCDAESMRVQDPEDPKRSIRVTTDALRAWSRAMLHGAKGVDLDTPPKCKECVPEDVQVLTVDEMAAKQEARMSRHKRGASPSRSPSKSLGGSSRTLSLGLDSQPSGLVFTPVRRSATGRILPPRLIPAEGFPSGDGRGAVQRRLSHQTNSPSISVSGDTPTSRASVDLTGPEDVGLEADMEETWRTCSPIGAAGSGRVSSSSTDIEVVPGRGGGILRSPSRKLARSPVGNGIEHNFSRLEFERPRSPSTMLSVSPTRKRPGSQSSSYPSMDLTNKPPLNDLGRALTIDGFLALCNFSEDDHVPRVLISLSHIRRWDFFLDTTLHVLQQMGFPYPIATQLLKGAKWLESTHVQQPLAPTGENIPNLVLIPREAATGPAFGSSDAMVSNKPNESHSTHEAHSANDNPDNQPVAGPSREVGPLDSQPNPNEPIDHEEDADGEDDDVEEGFPGQEYQPSPVY
ncbi:hypothetical protein PGT21_025760 [Puccinia graminis f. sp. tritici]|uniref:Uncharacterized protein n=2 Tax=Puccinia graminis f. sp. tritici TaxID=56615 RepID=E3KNU0_PUCGT|nr:uncharacterized protein PGTG_11721 [Puccinia graminis f. sp. tritici CRL 75-36-700-3]EFP85965.1 hypothetical protein PGTG_11721 [Puccinia graminis f. sp. tritici CRL 75-36-700-3]KAA1073792.1 hypothetical protein PGT21_025760 [Puccinia graminis f. sp. tritici]